MTAADRSELVARARTAVLTRSGERFDDPARVQRLADLVVELANALDREAPKGRTQ